MNKIRHLSATLVSALLPSSDCKQLANFMMHSEKVQQKKHTTTVSDGAEVRISEILKKLLCGQHVTDEDIREADPGEIYITEQCVYKCDIHSLTLDGKKQAIYTN